MQQTSIWLHQANTFPLKSADIDIDRDTPPIDFFCEDHLYCTVNTPRSNKQARSILQGGPWPSGMDWVCRHYARLMAWTSLYSSSCQYNLHGEAISWRDTYRERIQKHLRMREAMRHAKIIGMPISWSSSCCAEHMAMEVSGIWVCFLEGHTQHKMQRTLFLGNISTIRYVSPARVAYEPRVRLCESPMLDLIDEEVIRYCSQGSIIVSKAV